MKTLSKAIAIASLVSASAFTAQAANAEVSFNASLVSDYVFRGFSLSDGPALQGGVDYSLESGAYVGTWLSNVDDGVDTDVEYDIYAGYWMEVGEFEVDLMATTYSYLDGGYDTTELYATVTKGAVTAQLALDVDAYETTYLNAAYSMELPQDLALDLAVGYTIDGNDTWGDDIIDLSASVSKTVSEIDVAFTVTNVDMDYGQDQTLFVLSAGKEF